MRYTGLIFALCLFGIVQAQQPKPKKGSPPAYSRTLEWVDTLNPEILIGNYSPIAYPYTFTYDTTFNPNDTLKRDSTLGLALFIDTMFTLQSAICLRIRETTRHSYGKGWFYDGATTEEYLSLVDGIWVPDLDDRLFLIFVPRKQFQEGKKKGVNEQ